MGSDESFRAGDLLPSLPALPPSYEQTFTTEDFADLSSSFSSTPLIEGLLDLGSFALLVGDTNIGKTFIALDLALSIAQGRSWNGKAVSRYAVLYIAAEGGNAIKNRIVAYRKHFQLERVPLPFRLLRGSVDLQHSNAHVLEIIEATREAQRSFDLQVGLIVIDTFSRALSGGDENSSADMGALVKNIDLIRERTGAAILPVHHTGKDASKGARGHSLLKAAIDTEITLSKIGKTDLIQIQTTKQRDHEISDPFSVKLKLVSSIDSSGNEHSSCIVEPTARPEGVEKLCRLNTVSRKALSSLESLHSSHPNGVSIDEWRRAFREQHYNDSPRQTLADAFSRSKKQLFDTGYIEIENGIVYRVLNLSGYTVMSGKDDDADKIPSVLSVSP